MKNKSIYLISIFSGFILILCIIIICYLSNKYNILSQLRLREPCLMMVYYHNDANHVTSNEEIILLPLIEIQTPSDLETGLKKTVRLPRLHSMNVELENGKNEQLIAFSSVKTNDNTYRINIADNGVKISLDDVKYNGEQYLSIIHGENWYMAFTRRY